MPKSRLPSPEFRTWLPTAGKTSRLLLTGSLLLVLGACGGGGGGGPGFADAPRPTGPLLPPVTETPAPVAITPESLQIGNGTGDTFANGAISIGKTTVTAGDTTTLKINIVDSTGKALTDNSLVTTISLSSICTVQNLATISAPTELSLGNYSAQYSNTGCDGTDTITATLFSNSKTATVNLTVVGPEVLTVTFVESSVEQLSLAGIGGDESTELTFKVAGPQGVPIIGKQVNFSISSRVGGASILAGRETGTTNNEGLVRTILNSGTVAGPVNVLAVEAASGRQGLSTDIIISTGVPDARSFEVLREVKTLAHAFNITGISLNISVFVTDVFGNKPTNGTRVSFVTPESGLIGSSCEIVDGFCNVAWTSGGSRPADMRVTVIAYTDGAEQFKDNNGNSVFDAQDTGLVDLGEPFADENENGAYDVGEFFFDTNRNNVRDSGNGLWDGPCLVKVDPSAICTGNPTVSIFDTTVLVMSTDTARIFNQGTFPAAGSTITVAQGASISLSGMMIADSNTAADSLGGNPPPMGTSIAFSISGAGAALQGVTTDTLITNYLQPVGPYGVTIAAAAVDPLDALPVNVRLIMRVTVPDRTAQEFSWPVNITR